MPDSHGLMLHLGWEDLWKFSGPATAQGLGHSPPSPGNVLDFQEGNIPERTRNEEFCAQGTMGGGSQCSALGDKVGIDDPGGH